jgi:sec-independent protein translocase protein TatC
MEAEEKEKTSEKEKINDKDIGILDHLDEVRKRLFTTLGIFIVASTISFVFSNAVLELFRKPFSSGVQLVFITPLEMLAAKFKVALLGGVVFSLPFLLWQIVAFMMPGLYPREKKVIFFSISFGFLLFVGGVYFAFAHILPITLRYLLSLGSDEVLPMLSVGKYLSFSIMMVLSIGLIFQLPMVMLALSSLGIINYELLSKKRKYAIFGIFIVTAVITPTPDAITLIAVSFPLIFLFEISVWMIYFLEKFKRKEKVQCEEGGSL